MKKILFTGLIGFLIVGSILLFASFKNTPENNDYIIVRVIESNNHAAGLTDSKIIIIKGLEIVKSVELELVKTKNYDGNSIKIASAISEVKNQGYSLISSNSGGASQPTITNYIFEKK